MMKTFIFKRENRNFDDILKDKTIKRAIRQKFQFGDYLIIQVKETPGVLAYVPLMFSEELVYVYDLFPNRTPVPNVDYIPTKR